jgi:predicted anti-sigma-YlaC factor YlaD
MTQSCDDRQRWLARLADTAEAPGLSSSERAAIDAHVDVCDACRAALADQRLVASVLRSRSPLQPSASFTRSLAIRLDEAQGWLGLLDWRTWTFRLAPIAVAIFLAAVFSGSPATTQDSATLVRSSSGTTESASTTIEAWTRGVSESTSVASAVWQDRTSSDALLETMVLGSATREDANVR